MKPRSRAGGKASKARGREALKTKRRDASKTASSSAPIQDAEVARLTRELNEALERQAATSEVLEVISGSPGDLQPVFAAMLKNAVSICEAKFGNIYRWDGEALHILASHNTPPAFAEAVRRSPYRPYPNSPIGRMVANRTVAHINDVTAEEVYLAQRDPIAMSAVALGGIRTLLGVPLLNKGQMIGAFFLSRQEVRPFTEKQIALVQNFADQAVIAIENARLLNELRQSLKQQTATADVLKVISRSTFDLQPVLDALVETAAKLCAADMASIATRDGEVYRVKANYALNPEWNALVRTLSFRPGRDTVTGRTLLERQTVQIADITTDPEYALSAAASVGKIRTVIGVPLLREGDPTGVMQLARSRNEPFTERQIELIRTFADQAAIAIENARLLNELRQRTTDLTEALEQQTATSEVLQVISRSPGDLEPVFRTMLANAVRICDAKFGDIYRWVDGGLHLIASYNTPPAFAEDRKRNSPYRPGPEGPFGRMLATRSVVHTDDLAAEDVYVEQRYPGVVAGVELGGIRTNLAVPMLKDNELIGAFILNRQEVNPFSNKQIALVQSFAAQAVIAIENARLLTELRQRTDDLSGALEQQTATSEVLQVISSSPGELEFVFQTLLQNATRVCHANFGNLALCEGDGFRNVAIHNAVPVLDELFRGQLLHPHPDSPLSLAARHKRPSHVVDLRATPPYLAGNKAIVLLADVGGARTFLCVPMLKESEVVGVIVLYRNEILPFTDKQIELVKNFAAQAVIAIENARLLNELRQRTTDLTERTADLTEALEQQTATSEVLRVISASPGALGPVFQSMLENATRICDAAFGSMLLRDGDAYRRVALHNAPQIFSDFSKNAPILKRGVAPSADRVFDTKQVIHIYDLEAEEPDAPIAKFGGARTLLNVPMLKENEAIGLIGIYRQEVRSFTDKQVALLTNFAAQAVIAIENARLLNELRQSLEQQTAAAEVLQVISRSPGDLDPVFKSMLENAIRICEAQFGNIYRWDGEGLHALASHNTPAAFAEAGERISMRPGPKDPVTRMIGAKQSVHTADVAASEAYAEGEPLSIAAVELGGVRTLLCVPLLKDNELIGAFTLARHEVRAFTDKQIELVENFAAQAVIAIENARLLKELRERTDQVEKLNQHLEQRVSDQVGEIERMGRLRPSFLRRWLI